MVLYMVFNGEYQGKINEKLTGINGEYNSPLYGL